MKWTSVEVSLPEPDIEVLCYDKDSLTHWIGYICSTGGWYCDCTNEPIDVTHWMPLPEDP